jgi:hypothetical protein
VLRTATGGSQRARAVERRVEGDGVLHWTSSCKLIIDAVLRA